MAAERRGGIRVAAKAAAVMLALLSGGFAPAAAPAPAEPDWSALAREIAEETNRLRRDPPSYAPYLEAMLPRFDGFVLERPGRAFLRTEEGAPAVEEAISALRAAKPAPPLQWSAGLARAAGDHVRDQGPIGGTEHQGTDGSDPARRMERYGQWGGAVAENIAYGENPARDVVLQLVIDDGVPGRGHRDALLEADWGISGVACGRHRDYGQICVMDYAVRYVER
ncbi:MAG TPA: CAP domain-containing protein [Gemmatimonadales bacterium]|nr:CAP domain-containing protein [Gemmatimonadales bacterium]